MTINFKLVEKLAAERNQKSLSDQDKGALTMGGAYVAPSTVTSAIYAPLMFGSKEMPPDEYTKAHKVFNRMARRAGFEREGKTFRVSPGGGTTSTYFNPKTKKRVNFKYDVPGMGRGAGASLDGVIYSNGRSFRTSTTLAHEFGHLMQGKKLQAVNIAGKNIGGLAALGMLANTFYSDDPEKRDKRNKQLATVGSLGMGATLATEIDASARGAKLVGGWRNKLKVFKGVPSYVITGATPYLMYKAYKHFNKSKAAEDK